MNILMDINSNVGIVINVNMDNGSYSDKFKSLFISAFFWFNFGISFFL